MKLLSIASAIFSLGVICSPVFAEIIRLSDGTMYEGELGEPISVKINLSQGGTKTVPFTALTPEFQSRYRPKGPNQEAGPQSALAPSPSPKTLTNDELLKLYNQADIQKWAAMTLSDQGLKTIRSMFSSTGTSL